MSQSTVFDDVPHRLLRRTVDNEYKVCCTSSLRRIEMIQCSMMHYATTSTTR